MKYVKMHGCGNDFLIVDALREDDFNRNEIAVKMCDRHYGVGADGLIVIDKGSTGLFRMNIFNADGSSALMCGNGIRCMAWYLYNNKLVENNEWEIETPSGNHLVYVNKENNEYISVEMGCARYNNTESLMGEQYPVSHIDIGNPHAVIVCENEKEYESYDIKKIGSFIEKSNVEIVYAKDFDNLVMKVWERGCGETLSCGTGACAAFAAAYRYGKCAPSVHVLMPGGMLDVIMNKKSGGLILTGKCSYIADGTIFEN